MDDRYQLLCEEWFSCSQFDHILIRCPRLTAEPKALAASAKPLLAKNGSLVLLFPPPRLGERISRILSDECAIHGGAERGLASKLKQAEESFFENTAITGLYGESELAAAFEELGFTVEQQIIDQKKERLITEKDLSAWFNTEQSRWGSFMAKNLEKDDFQAIEDAMRQRIAQGSILWRWRSILHSVKLCR